MSPLRPPSAPALIAESEWAAAALGFRCNFSGLNSLERALSLRPLYA